MTKISVEAFIKELDSFFAKNDLQGAGRCLLEWRDRAVFAGDKRGELSILNEMTGFYRQTSDEENGMNAIRDAFRLIEETGIKNELSAGTIYLNCATTMKSFGKITEAMKYYDKALEIFKINLDENDPLFAGFYNNIALAMQDLKQYSRAEECFLRANEINMKSVGNELETAISYVNLAHLYYEINPEDERVNPLMERALEILECEDYFGYKKYAFTCKKCAPSFGYFGFFFAERELNERADRIYAGS